MEEALIRILTPRRSIDILRDVHAAKEQRKPYVVVFVGVNGVGKSTNLAKVGEPYCFSIRSRFDIYGMSFFTRIMVVYFVSRCRLLIGFCSTRSVS